MIFEIKTKKVKTLKKGSGHGSSRKCENEIQVMGGNQESDACLHDEKGGHCDFAGECGVVQGVRLHIGRQSFVNVAELYAK